MALTKIETTNDRRERLKKVKVQDLPGEKWVDVIGFEGHYMVSDCNRIKSLGRIIERGDGVSVFKPEQLRIPQKNTDGYLCLVLVKDRIKKATTLHIVVAGSFEIPNPLGLSEVNHIDGDKENCRPLNLEYGTHKHNMNHAVKIGLKTYHGNCKKKFFSKQQVIAIYNSAELTIKIANKYGVTKSSIQRIKNGKTYSQITGHGKH